MELAVSRVLVVLPIRKSKISWIVFGSWPFNDQIIDINW